MHDIVYAVCTRVPMCAKSGWEGLLASCVLSRCRVQRKLLCHVVHVVLPLCGRCVQRLLAIYQAPNIRIPVHVQEERQAEPPLPRARIICRRARHAVHRTCVPVVCPPSQQVTDIANETTGRASHVEPISCAFGLDLQTCRCLGQDGERSSICERTCYWISHSS